MGGVKESVVVVLPVHDGPRVEHHVVAESKGDRRLLETQQQRQQHQQQRQQHQQQQQQEMRVSELE